MIAADPMFANLKDDPRWLPFLRKQGKSPEQLAAIRFDVPIEAGGDAARPPARASR